MTATAPAPAKVLVNDDPRYTTPEELEQYETMLEKNFIRKDNDKDAKLFHYKIISLHPRFMGAREDEAIQQFNVQKYHKDKFVNVPGVNGKTQKQNVACEQFDDNGKKVCDDASFFMDCEKFVKQFKAE